LKQNVPRWRGIKGVENLPHQQRIKKMKKKTIHEQQPLQQKPATFCQQVATQNDQCRSLSLEIRFAGK